MFDWLGSGIFGGFFAKPMSIWLRRFKLLTIFIAVVIGVHVASFIQDGWSNGWGDALHRSLKFAFTPAGFFVPIGIGFGSVFIVVINALSMTGKKTAEQRMKDGGGANES